MLNNLIKFTHMAEGKAIELTCTADTQISHIKEAICNFLGHCVNVENQIKANQAAVVPEAPAVPVEDSVGQPVAPPVEA